MPFQDVRCRTYIKQGFARPQLLQDKQALAVALLRWPRCSAGHALNKILKDFILKFQLLQGKRAQYVPGWDCHGLPIELKVLQGMTDEQRRELTTIKLRRKARDFALKAVNQQREGFKR